MVFFPLFSNTEVINLNSSYKLHLVFKKCTKSVRFSVLKLIISSLTPTEITSSGKISFKVVLTFCAVTVVTSEDYI